MIATSTISHGVGLLETIQHSGAKTRHCVARIGLYRMGLLVGKRHSPNPTCYRVIAATAAHGSVLSTWWIVAIVEIAPFFDDSPRIKDSGLCARLPTLEVMQGKTHWSCRFLQKLKQRPEHVRLALNRLIEVCGDCDRWDAVRRNVPGPDAGNIGLPGCFIILFLIRPVLVLDSETTCGFGRFSFLAALSEDRQPISRFDHELGHGLLLVENGGSTAWSPK